MIYALCCAESLGEVADVGFQVCVVFYASLIPFVPSELLIADLADFPFH